MVQDLNLVNPLFQTVQHAEAFNLNDEPQASASSHMTRLATIIAKNTAILDAYFQSQDGPKPSFEIDGLQSDSSLPQNIRVARRTVLEATKELQDLITGPIESVRYMAWSFNDQLSLNALLRLKIVDSFPVGETTTYSEISKSTGLTEKNVRRFTQHAMTNHILKEVSAGLIAHTAASRALVEDPVLRDWVRMNTEEILPSSAKTIDALERYPKSQDMTQCGFQLANGTENIEPMFTTLGRNPARAKRFGNAMSSLSNGEGYELAWLLDNYDWERINAKGGTLVDVGGSHGFVPVEIGQKYPNMRFVVQDLPKTIQSAPALPEGVKDRISFQAHDFYTPQPVKDADIYFFRWIFHNLPDKNAVIILKQLIPALKHGARIVINDHCLPTRPGQYSAYDEKIMRSMDLVVLTLLNADERTEDEFQDLFKRASDGFTFLGVKRLKGCRMSVVEAVWNGEDYGGVKSIETP